ncbi:50S ribosomal protein L6 [Candidatus Dependentiae bacterium]|nr:50S ribosomal protein L6 [Candidatus Dependentiae bacterium]
MSKIGKKPIPLEGVKVEIKGQEVHYTGKRSSGVHELDPLLVVEVKDNNLYITPVVNTNNSRRVWGLHRALLSNKIVGAHTGFKKQLRIVGLGYKAVATGSKIQFSLGYSHKGGYKDKSDFELPQDVTIEIDKSGQMLTFESFNKDLLGQVCSDVRALRPPEPYKGTGIQYVTETIIRKAGKAKS